MKNYLFTLLLVGLSVYFSPTQAHQHSHESTPSSPHSAHCPDLAPSSSACTSDFMKFGEKMWQKMINAISSATDHIYAYWTHPESLLLSNQNNADFQKLAPSHHHTIFGTPLAHIIQPQAQIKTTTTHDNAHPIGIPLAQVPLGESEVRTLSSSEPLESEPKEESTQKEPGKSTGSHE